MKGNFSVCQMSKKINPTLLMEVSAGCLCPLKMHFFTFCIETDCKKVLDK